MNKQDEINKGIVFTDTFQAFPDHFTFIKQQKIKAVLEKINSLLPKHNSVEATFIKEHFTDEEIEDYALWRASIYYSNHPPQVKDLKRAIFETLLYRFTKYYRKLAGSDS